MDLSLICRSCMKGLSAWEKENFDTKMVEMFIFCTNIKIPDEDQLPQQFCSDCIVKIESSYFYIKEAQKVDLMLKNLLSRTSTSVIVEPENCYKNINEQNKAVSSLSVLDYNINSTDMNSTENIVLVNLENEINVYDDEKTTDEHEPNFNGIQSQIENCNEADIETPVENIDRNETTKKVCPVCRKAFTSQTWFSKHMQKEHSEEKFCCTQCPKTFSKQSQLSYHKTTHSEERNFPCSACGKRFKRRKHLAVHARSHDDAKPYACDKCEMRFKKRSVLKCHMKVHEDDKQYLCSYCGWSFSQAGNLEVHMRRHTGEKPFSCSECGFRAAAASNLRRHERRHRGTRTHVCGTCRKGFYDASALARHVRTHSGARPFACGRCARAFADSWKRKLHLMRAHRHQLHELKHLDRAGRVVAV
ncbi:hypothetical protein ABMA28_012392 [Loxostege sticticalis]|uniref:Uncharacterized protein n=1 Tax=Loxostege sticticalis TaxID=481309 RepID=A0ABD0TMN8_LOXSC